MTSSQHAFKLYREQGTHAEKDTLICQLRDQLMKERIGRIVAEGKLKLLQLSMVQLSFDGFKKVGHALKFL